MTLARDLLEAKLALEAELARPLYKAGRDYVAAWEDQGGNLGAYTRLGHLTRIQAILVRHYARVTMVMQGRRPPKNPSLADACRTNQHLQSLADQAHRNAQLILASLDRELARGLTASADVFSADDLLDDGMSKDWGLDDLEMKDTTTRKPKVTGVTAGYMARIKMSVMETLRKWKQKIGAVVNANTNPQAEQARDEVAKGVEVVPDRESNGRMVKIWVCKMDGRERDWHHDAHGQEVSVDSPYIVGGERLMFPGDPSMGASLRNRINCRCASRYEFVGDDGTRQHIHMGVSAPTRRYRKPGDTQPPVLKPTSTVTLNGRTVARVVLGDGRTIATLRQRSNSTIEVLVDRRVIARADVAHGRVERMRIDGAMGAHLDIEGLIRRSVGHSSRMDRQPYSRRP